ncbi:hypothetical protein TeGR_g11187, partial [Tetraparma gracilis]
MSVSCSRLSSSPQTSSVIEDSSSTISFDASFSFDIDQPKGDLVVQVMEQDGRRDRLVGEAVFALNKIGDGVEAKPVRLDKGGLVRIDASFGEEPQQGDRCEAQFKGKGKFYPGTIAKVNSDGTVNVDFDDGDKDRYVSSSSYKLSGSGGKKSPRGGRSDTETNDDDGGKLEVGAKVEAKYRGKSKYYKGEIARVRLNGTYDINYDDGEKELGVKRDLIRPLESSSRSRSPKKSSKEPKVGDKCEAQFKGKGKFYKGKVAKVNSDGTINVDFDDGDKDRYVEPECFKILSSSSRDESDTEAGGDDSKLSVGAKVEAKYRGKSKYYKGEIARVRLNGTYDINYDDGEKELGVKRDLIRPLESSSRSSSKSPKKGSKPRVGQKCTAQFKGKGKFYKGKVAKVNSDGTINVDFDDGDKDRYVEPESFKLEEGDDASETDGGDDDSKLSVGDKVEAKYRGKSK